MTGLLQELRYALRQLRKSPGFTAVAIITLSLGIGANTAMFTIIDSALLRPLPYKESGRIVVFDGVSAVDRGGLGHWADWVNKSRTLEDITVYETGQVNLVGASEPERVPAVAVSPRFFPLLGIVPEIGRAALSKEEGSGKERAALISDGLWRSQYAADPGIVGRVIRLNDQTYTILGVTPPGFSFPQQSAIWLFSDADKHRIFTTPAVVITQMGRLRQGVSLAQARAELEVFARQEPRDDSEKTGPVIQLATLHEHLTGNVRSSLFVLFVAVGFVLLIACANVANLLLARNTGRLREMAIRTAIGARRWNLIRPMLIEGLLLSVSGTATGAAVGTTLATLSSHFISSMPLATRPALDARVFVFTFGVALFTGLLCGILPAWQLSKTDPNEALKDGAPGIALSPASSRHHLGNILAASEVGLALILLIGSGLLIRSLANLLQVNPGFRTDHLLTARIDLAGQEYAVPQQRAAFFEQVLERMKMLPAVRNAAVTSNVPLGKDMMVGFYCGIEGHSNAQEGSLALYSEVSPSYFSTMGIPLVQGRDFSASDRGGTKPVVVVSQKTAKQFWPNENPVGKRITIQDPPQWMEVIGVAEDVRSWDLGEPPSTAIYVPLLQRPPNLAFLAVETRNASTSLAADMRRIVQGVDKNEPISSIRSGDELLSQSTADPRSRTLLLGIFSSLALLLAAIGVYGIMAHLVSRRTHEVGIRIALGARPSDVLKLVLWQGTKLSLAGIAVGLAGALGLTRFLSSSLYGVRPLDPQIFGAVSGLLFVIALAASYIPARRAANVDPMVALRYE